MYIERLYNSTQVDSPLQEINASLVSFELAAELLLVIFCRPSRHCHLHAQSCSTVNKQQQAWGQVSDSAHRSTMACPTVILSGYNLPKINCLHVILRIFFKQVSADLHHLRFHLMYIHIQNLSNCCKCMIGQFIQYLILDGFLKLGPTLHALIQ